MNRLYINSLSDIQDTAKEFLSLFSKPTVVAFVGEMGAGKTTFIKAVCKELGVVDTVNSPTFAIINDYETKDGSNIYHFDLYRIEKAEEVEEIGFEDYLYSGKWCFVEWPEIADNYFPNKIVKVKIEELEDGRRQLSIKDL